MSELATQLLNQLLNLPDVEKYQIADKLWESFTLQKKEEIVSEITEDPEFQVELERRLASIEDGTAVLIDGEQVFRETRERLQKEARAVIFHFLQDARIEFDYAVDWYDSRQPGLGDDFSREVYDTIRRIIANPHAFVRAPRVPKKREVRILPVHRFEYLLVYEVLSAEIVIIGVPHARRGVQHWRKRL